jgi:hypothetical protein
MTDSGKLETASLNRGNDPDSWSPRINGTNRDAEPARGALVQPQSRTLHMVETQNDVSVGPNQPPHVIVRSIGCPGGLALDLIALIDNSDRYGRHQASYGCDRLLAFRDKHDGGVVTSNWKVTECVLVPPGLLQRHGGERCLVSGTREQAVIHEAPAPIEPIVAMRGQIVRGAQREDPENQLSHRLCRS